MDIRIEPPDVTHFPALRAIELASFETLRAAGAVGGDPAANGLEKFEAWLEGDALLAAFGPDGVPVGFGAAEICDGWLHVAEIDVLPAWQRMGIGRRLMDALLGLGRARGLRGATLTTDRLAPFNGPFYASLGFEVLEGPACPPHLASALAAETAAGLDPLRRVAMKLEFGAAGARSGGLGPRGARA